MFVVIVVVIIIIFFLKNITKELEKRAFRKCKKRVRKKEGSLEESRGSCKENRCELWSEEVETRNHRADGQGK